MLRQDEPMTTRFMILAAVLMLSAPLAWAHENYRVIGTITKVSKSELYVKQAKDGKVIGMDMDDKTVVKRDSKKIKTSELKAGQSVVADAWGDSLEELLVIEVKIVPSRK